MRAGFALRPYGPDDLEAFAKLPLAKLLRAEVSAPRNAAHHRLYWALCARVAEYLYSDKRCSDLIDEYFRLETGHCTLDRMPDGEIRKRAKSLSFGAMDQSAFGDYFEACVRLIYGELKIPPEVVADLLLPEGTTTQALAGAGMGA